MTQGRSQPNGVEVHRALGLCEDFLTGFGVDPSGPETWERPVGLLILPDSSLLFAEEMNGRIYRLRYTESEK